MRKLVKSKWFPVVLALAMILTLLPAMAGAETVNGNGPEKIIYGVVGDGNTGSLWMIDPTADPIVEEKIVDIIDVNGEERFYPNGLAFDEDNNRLYYAIRKSTGTNIYFYDLDTETFATAVTGLSGEIYGATWGDGKYWYIPNGTSNLYSVTFDVNGINGTASLFEGNFTGVNKSFNFGDIALDAEENVIYVSTSFSGSNREFFKYDLNEGAGNRYELITTTTKAVGLQLGFGTGGVLYGHNTFGEFPRGTTDGDVAPMEWFEVGKDGATTSLGAGINKYNDLSSGPVEIPTYGFCGYKFADGEPAEDWVMKLEVWDEGEEDFVPYKDNNEQLTATTDEDGRYCFTDLPAGTYRVYEKEQTGYTQVYPDDYHEVTLPDDVIVYGVETDTGDLYEINVITGDKALIFADTQNDSNEYFPNALAFDNENQRLYYATENGKLYFHELGSAVETDAGDLGDKVAGATFGGGYYWYMPNGTDDLFKVSFDENGIQDEIIPVESNISGEDNLTFNFGDIVVKDGIIYGSTTGSLDTVYFTYDIADETFNVVSETDALNLQLAFAVNGLLYGHSTGSQAWYSIEMATGVTTELDWSVGERSFTDLASGKFYDFYNEKDDVKVCETAWGYDEDAASPNNEVIINEVENPSNAWGWTNWFDGEELVMDLYAGAAQNDTTKGELVGTVTVECVEGDVTVTYKVKDGYWISEAHLWVGDTELPVVRRGRTETPTSAPGQFTYSFSTEETDVGEYDFVTSGYGCTFWVAAHAVVCWYD